MTIIKSDTTVEVAPGTTPNYNVNNPIWKVATAVENVKMAAELEYYDFPSLQYLFNFSNLNFYSPQGSDYMVTDPSFQDNKEDFQKQNVKEFALADIRIVRGWVQSTDFRIPFLQLSYRGGPDSVLSKNSGHTLSDKIKVWIKIGASSQMVLVTVPYNVESDRYETELWGYQGMDLRGQLDQKGKNSFDKGMIQSRPDLIQGHADDFRREKVTDRNMREIAPNHLMHPIIPLHLEMAWCNESETVYDSNEGKNYHMEFSMLFRGWNNFLQAGVSANPHGGVGFLEYRNLESNYFGHKVVNELGRDVYPFSFDAFGSKSNVPRRERFMAVDYMDLHILRPTCGIGIHRHRDNQEIFLMMEGRGLMIMGDWLKFPSRERCFEVRTMVQGDYVHCKNGQIHGLLNNTDYDIKLFMFGGYD